MSSDYYEAVMFFDEKSVVKEMRYSEFEAVLDSMVGIPEFSGIQIKAAYITLTESLQITSCVMFLMGFDQKGNVDQDWNIPIRHLASRGGPGPNLGAGPIRLACRSQCSIAWHQSELWEPQEQGSFDPFKAMSRALERNKLGFKKGAEPQVQNDIPVISDIVSRPQSASSAKEKDPATGHTDAHVLKAHKESLAAVQTEADKKLAAYELKRQEETDQIIRAYRNETLALQQEQRTLQHSLREQTIFHETLQKKYLDLQDKNDQWRGEVGLLKDQLSGLQQDHSQLILEQSKHQGSLEVHESTLQAELLESKTLIVAEQQEVIRLKGVLAQTESDKRGMVKDFIDRLKALDILFVAYHLGAGHISLTPDTLTEYLDNPEVFAAQKCNVSLELYQAWVTHYELSQCDICHVTIPRISMPDDFELGQDHFCQKHKSKK